MALVGAETVKLPAPPTDPLQQNENYNTQAVRAGDPMLPHSILEGSSQEQK
jgi:hypothetical protein